MVDQWAVWVADSDAPPASSSGLGCSRWHDGRACIATTTKQRTQQPAAVEYTHHLNSRPTTAVLLLILYYNNSNNNTCDSLEAEVVRIAYASKAKQSKTCRLDFRTLVLFLYYSSISIFEVDPMKNEKRKVSVRFR